MPHETITTPTVDVRSLPARWPTVALSAEIPAVMVGVPLVILPGFSSISTLHRKVVILLVGTAAVLPLWGAWAPGLARLLQDGARPLVCRPASRADVLAGSVDGVLRAARAFVCRFRTGGGWG